MIPDPHLAFAQKYGVTFTRETYTLSQIIEGQFTLKPSAGDPLPPIGCEVMVHDYAGRTWRTVVTAADAAVGTYTAMIE